MLTKQRSINDPMNHQGMFPDVRGACIVVAIVAVFVDRDDCACRDTGDVGLREMPSVQYDR